MADVSCFLGSVGLDNKSSPLYTAVTVESQDYPGLLRVIAWFLNGSGLRVHNAVMSTDSDGQATDTFWVTDIKGRKLKDKEAEEVAERLQDFVHVCQPNDTDGEFKEYVCGPVEVSNVAHPTSTQVTVTADIFSPGLLLELASVIHGQGISISEAVIRGGEQSPIPEETSSRLPSVPEPPAGKRVMRFWLRTARDQRKLDLSEVSALVYTMGLVMGAGAAPTTPPNTKANIVCLCSDSSADGF